MKVVYSKKHFARHYKQLPSAAQAQFQLIDAQVRTGNLDVLRKNAWVYHASLGGGFVAWGTLQADDVFFWRDIDVPAKVPIIL